MNNFDDLGEAMKPEGGKPSARVTPLRADVEKLKPRARALLNSVVVAQEMVPIVNRPYLVKGWLDKAALSVLFGPSNSGKSFFAVDLAHHIAKGLSWAGRRVNVARVLYVAAEGGGNFANRVAALEDPRFWVLPVPLTLTGRDSAAVAVAEMMQHLAAVGGSFDLIIIDTMARVMGGGDENAAPDIADLIRNLDHIRRERARNQLVHPPQDTGAGRAGIHRRRSTPRLSLAATKKPARSRPKSQSSATGRQGISSPIGFVRWKLAGIRMETR